MILIIVGAIIFLVSFICLVSDSFDNIGAGVFALIIGFFVAGVGIFGSLAGTEYVLTGTANLVPFSANNAQLLSEVEDGKFEMSELEALDGDNCYILIAHDWKTMKGILEYNGTAKLSKGNAGNIKFDYQDIEQPIVERYEEKPIKNAFSLGVAASHDVYYIVKVPKTGVFYE